MDRRDFTATLFLASCFSSYAQNQDVMLDQVTRLQMSFDAQVDKRLTIPAEEQARYHQLVSDAFAKAGKALPLGEFILTVDRSEKVQAASIYWLGLDGKFTLVGASAVATGKPGTFEHFKTPLGIFLHSPANPDYRAEGTRNENGIRGYGKKGMRVFDFGWVTAPKGWGKHESSVMRLQLHATDPDILEPRLGLAASKGCIRVPASFIEFLDSTGILDAEYRDELLRGKKPLAIRSTSSWPDQLGRYLVVLETERSERPDWSPVPQTPTRSKHATK